MKHFFSNHLVIGTGGTVSITKLLVLLKFTGWCSVHN